MKSIKPYLFTLLCLFLTSTVFLSCSNENIEENDLNSELQKLTTSVLTNNSYLFKLIEKNTKNENLSSVFEEIKICKTELQLRTVFSKYYIKDSDLIINLLKQQGELFKDFLKFNPSFNKITNVDKRLMLLSSFEKSGELIKLESNQNKSNVIYKTNSGNGPDCDAELQKALSLCTQSYYIDLAADGTEISLAIYLAPESGGLSLLVGVGLLAQDYYEYYQCQRGASDEYSECMKSRSPCSGKVRKERY